MAKLVFGAGFGILFFIYLNLFPSKIQNFTENQIPFINYLLPPKRKSLLKKYQKAQEEITQLRDILPICSKCKKIRDDEGYWNQLEQYLAEKEEVYFSHSLCPECAKELLDELDTNEK